MSTKNKKNFSDGLETMFNQSLEDGAMSNPSHLAETTTKKRAGKGFQESLSLFFEESIQEAIEEQTQKLKSTDGKDSKTTRRTKPVIGLDLLIRSTVEGAIIENDKKRITFTFEKNKIDKLRKIAELEKARIRDIVDELVSDYIKKYKSGLEGNS
jgi:hypothetical protein